MRFSILTRSLLLIPLFAVALLAFAQPNFSFFPMLDNDGKTRVFWEDGTLKAMGQLEEGIRQGTWESYYNNGNRSELGQYRDGVRIGLWSFWKEDGVLDRVEQYADPGFLQKGGLPMATIGDLRTSEGWQTLALGAAYCLEFAHNHPDQKQSFIDQGIQWIKASVKRDENYYNTLIKARLYEQRNFNDAKEAASRAHTLGLKTIPNFKETDDCKMIEFMLSNTGC